MFGDDPKLASLKQGIVFFPSMLRRFGSIDSTSKGGRAARLMMAQALWTQSAGFDG